MNELLFNDGQTSEVILSVEEMYENIGCQDCKVLSGTFWEGAAKETPEKIKAVGFVTGVRQCHDHKVSATTNKLFFEEK